MDQNNIQQYTHRLDSIRLIDISNQNLLNSQLSPGLSKHKKTSQKKMQQLHKVFMKIKVKNLVDQFVYKLRRSISKNKQLQYKAIQSTISKKLNQQNLLKPFFINQKYRAIILGLDIICVLIIQILSTFQGFYVIYQEGSSKNLIIIFVELFCLIIFILVLIIGFTNIKIDSAGQQKHLMHVFKHYLLSLYFALDLLNFLTTLLKMIFPLSSLIGKICFTVSILCFFTTLSRDLQFIQWVFVDNFLKRQYFNMAKILMFNIFFIQFVSTILIAITLYDEQHNWIKKAIRNGNIKDQLEWWQYYSYSIYYAVVTIATIGYGDITPDNYFQAIILSIIMFFGTIVLSYNVSSIGNIIENIRKIDQKRKQQTIIFKRMAKDSKISLKLQDKILEFIYESAQVHSKFQFNQRKKFLQKLPPHLRQEFQAENANNMFSKIPFFKLLSDHTLINFSLKLKGQIYYPNEQMIRKNGNLQKIMFLKSGKVGFAYDRSGSKLNGLILQSRSIDNAKDNPYLLNKYLLTQDRQINYQIIAQAYSFMLVIQYQDFYSILRQNKLDYQFYFHMFNKISYIDQQWDIFQCKYCSPKRHSIFLCPRLHYMPYKSMIISRYLYGINIPQQQKNNYKRRIHSIKKKHTLKFWRNYYKKFQVQWQITKLRIKKNRIYQEWFYVNDTDHIRRLNGQKMIEQINQTQQEQVNRQQNRLQQIIKNENDIIKKIQELLKKHQIHVKYERDQKLYNCHFQMDRMHNFTNFFPKFNPNKLLRLKLKSPQKNNIKISTKSIDISSINLSLHQIQEN